MQENKLFKTNLLISIILIIGFILTAILSYQANYQASLVNIEQVSSLTAEGIYYQLTTMFTKPVNISLTMAHDSLLIDHLLNEPEHMEDEDYIRTTKTYLDNYKQKYNFDSVFLVSTLSGRYYNFNGLDRVLERGNPENVWYYELLDSGLEYSLNVDNDEVMGADNKITVFVNCKITEPDGSVVGVVGVGIRMDYMKELLTGYEERYGINASLINEDGVIEISTTYTGYEKVDWFETYDQEGIRDQVLGWKKGDRNLELWSVSQNPEGEKSYVVSRYIPELTWDLVVEQDTSRLIEDIHNQMYRTGLILAIVILTVVVVITNVIRNFDKQITKLTEERQAIFKKATEQLYDSIYELNLSKNCYVGKPTEEYFASMGAGGLPFDQGLRVIAEKQIKEEYREGYVAMFSPDNVIREYEAGNNHLSYDFMMSMDGGDYHWMRVETYIFFSEEDQSIHMFAYRKNIDEEKKKEFQAATDEMTGLFTKKMTERLIDRRLMEYPGARYAFMIFDIDRFKDVNDHYGHAFGDFCICSFTQIIKEHFREEDIVGRIGGDEFAVFIPVSDLSCVEAKAAELSRHLNTVICKGGVTCKISASIGIAISPRDGINFESLYHKADVALYQTKQRGKNNFTIYDPEETTALFGRRDM
ncbi:sensor domain-containing diguanylate cyclase [Enterocloster lavalensis]|uniref:sensor domain-containing diguanylate cyclase n=1 Tax=Enterocloster lavalensis TaxID=460384 RepID=UPI002A81BD0A|nr:sensor domain-containing diguanylate cyclase [Enterocloster lavalensis]